MAAVVMVSLRAQLARVRDMLFPRHMCVNKKRYLTHAYALKVKRLRQPMEDAPLFIYHCPECEGWHLTRMEQPS